MTLHEFFSTRYQYEEGENGALAIRRKTQRNIGIFGRGTARADDPFLTVREAMPVLMLAARKEVGPCTRLEIITAVHDAAEIQWKAEAEARRNK